MFVAEELGEEVNGLSVMEKAVKAVEAIKKLVYEIELPTSLTEIGINCDLIETMAESVIKDFDLNGNPRRTTIQDIIELYNNAV